MTVEGRTDGTLHALLVAVDGGPRETLSPYCVHAACGFADVDHPDAERAEYWRERLAAAQAKVLVAGTSDSARGRCVETAARRAAKQTGVRIVAIEDFPGNYNADEGSAADLLIVESDAAADIARARLGNRTPALAVVTPARYERYHAQAAALRQATAARWSKQRRTRVLWAGQPETADCLATLEPVVHALAQRGVQLLFKAHPRDAGHAAGAYRELLADSRVDSLDVTAYSVAEALAQGPRLVVTQFSSVALECGFHGIPGLWILLTGAGGDRLLEKKGYRVPALCTSGGGACADAAVDVDALLGRCLEDEAYRAELMRGFDAYCDIGCQQPSAIGEQVLTLLRAGQ